MVNCIHSVIHIMWGEEDQMVDIRTIQIIQKISQKGSFQKAAEELYLSQPALSQYISRIEKELGYKLYNRIDGKCILTGAGEVLLKEGTPILEEFDKMLADMKEISRKQSDNITIGCPTGYTVTWFSDFLKDNVLDGMKIKIVEDTVENLIRLLLNKNTDMIFIPALYRHKNLIYKTICEEISYLAVPKGSKWDMQFRPKGRMVSVAELENIPYILDVSIAHQYLVEKVICNDVNLNTIFKANDWDIALHLVSEGVGITLIPYWKTGYNREKVAYYPIEETKNACRIFSYVYNKDTKFTDAMQKIVDHVVSKFGDSESYKEINIDHLPLKYK